VTIIEILAITAAFLTTSVAGFHVALAAGVPWGAAAYGGRAPQKNGTLSIRYRITSAVSVVLLAVAGCLILVAGSVIDQGPLPTRVVNVVIWVLPGFPQSLSAPTADRGRSAAKRERPSVGSHAQDSRLTGGATALTCR
jgi:hypothetical protein